MKRFSILFLTLLFTLLLALPVFAYLGNPRTMKFHQDDCQTIKHRQFRRD
ncbi:hypothetical protein [Acidaminococcus massiliensis]|nr:hypothetical protein [Acidaminococcus massiliensis]